MNKQNSLLKTLAKPILAGVTGAALGYFFFNDNDDLMVFFGHEVNGRLALAGTIAASTFAGEIVGNYVLPKIPGNYRFSGIEKMLLSPVGTGAAIWLIGAVGTPNGANIAWWYPFVLGGGANILSEYEVNTLKQFKYL